MAGEDKRIRVSADTAPINDIRNSVASLSRELLSFYKENEQIWRSGINNLEKQIRLLEKKNSLERPTQTDVRTASQTQAQVSSQVTQPFDFDKGRSVEILDDIKTILQQILAKEDKDSTKPPTTRRPPADNGDREEKDSAVAREIRGQNIANTIIKGGLNPMSLVGTALQMIPVVGNGLASALQTIISSGKNAEAGALGLTQLTGGEVNSVASSYTGGIGFRGMGGPNLKYAETLGMAPSEYMARRAQLIRQAGGKSFSMYGDETTNVMAMQRITGLDDSTVSQLQGSQRFSIGGVGSTTIVGTIEKSLRQAGKPIEEIRATLKEYVDTYNSTSQKQLEVMGSFDSKELVGALMAIQQATGAEGKQLRRYQEAFTGQSIATDDVTNALLLRTARRLNPNGKYSDLMADIEKVRSGGDKDFMKSFLGQLEGMAGSKESYRMILKSIFTNLSQNDINAFTNNEISTDELFKKVNASSGRYNLDGSEKTVGAMTAADAIGTTFSEAVASTFAPAVASFNDGIVKLIDSLNKWLGNSAPTEAQQRFYDDVNDIKNHIKLGEKEYIVIPFQETLMVAPSLKDKIRPVEP